MSADNWTVCPQCEGRVSAANKARSQKASDSYGVVPLAEYEHLTREARKPIPLESTLREDYEIGIWKGKFEVSYQAHCTKCGWVHRFKHQEPI